MEPTTIGTLVMERIGDPSNVIILLICGLLSRD